MAPVAEEESAPAEALDEALDAPVQSEDSDAVQGRDEVPESQKLDKQQDAEGDTESRQGTEGEEEILPDVDKSSENVGAAEADSDSVGGGKEVDESAAESIAQPDVPDEAQWAAEEVQGPEVTSDRLQEEPVQEGAAKQVDDKAKEPDVMSALYERMSSAIARAQAAAGKKDKGDDPDPVVDSVIAMAAPFIQLAVAQAQALKNTMQETTDVAVRAACNQLGELQDSTTTHYYYAKDKFWRLKREYREYENAFFSSLKDGVRAAQANPGTTVALLTGAAFIFLRRPRRFLFKYTLGQFRNPESMVASTQRKVVEMRQALEQQKNEKRKLEERFRLAEDEYLRGQAKMSNTGTQIRSLVKSMYKTEKQAQGLVEKLRDMSGSKPAVLLRAEVASMASEAKQHRSALDKDLYKIARYNIRV